MNGESRRAPSLANIFVMMLASQMALTIFLPAVPDMSRDLATSLESIQLIIPAYLAAFAAMQLVAGPLSDAFGRRPVILGGLTLFAAASLVCGLVDDISLLLVARFFQAMGSCTTIVVGRAVIRDATEGKSAVRAMSYLGIALAAGPAIAPFIGGFLVSWFDWRAAFFLTGALAVAALLISLPTLPESLPPAMREKPNLAAMLRNYSHLIQRAQFLRYALTVSFLSGVFQTFMVSSPIVIVDRLGVSPELFGFYVMIVPAGFMVASFAAGRLASRFSVDTVIGIGCTFGVSGALLQLTMAIWLQPSPIMIVAAVIISNVGTGLAFSSCYAQVLSIVSPAIAGAASALIGFVHMGWGFLVSLAVANLTHTSSLQLGMAQMTTTCLAALVFIGLGFHARTARF